MISAWRPLNRDPHISIVILSGQCLVFRECESSLKTDLNVKWETIKCLEIIGESLADLGFDDEFSDMT